jgi:hypothetical protein
LAPRSLRRAAISINVDCDALKTMWCQMPVCAVFGSGVIVRVSLLKRVISRLSSLHRMRRNTARCALKKALLWGCTSIGNDCRRILEEDAARLVSHGRIAGRLAAPSLNLEAMTTQPSASGGALLSIARSHHS